MLRRLLGKVGSGSASIDTQVLSGGIRPGDTFPGQMVLRAVDSDIETETFSLTVVAKYPDLVSGEGQVDQLAHIYADGPFQVRKGQEKQVPFSLRLPWETPVTEHAGRALGTVLELRTQMGEDDAEGVADYDLIHVDPLPLHEAVLDAFAGQGFACQSAELVGERVPGADQLFDFHQVFALADRGAAAGGPGDLEVAFLTNAVGCEVFVRAAAAPGARYWDEKTPARRFVAAHHDADRVDFPREARQWIEEVALLTR